MSYITTVQSFNPVAFWYLNQALTSEGMVDISGNAKHGTFRTDSVTLGLASPIETDATSRSGGSKVGYYYDAGISGSTLDLRNAFTWIGWGYADGAVWHKTVVSRLGGTGFSKYTGMSINANDNASGSIHISGTNYTLTDPATLPDGHFPMIAVTRNGTVMRLYCDGVLVAERTDLPSGAIVDADYNDSGWKVGFAHATTAATSGATSGVWEATKTCAVSLHPNALSAADIRAIYESALNVLPLRATIIINLGVELNTDQITPTDLPFAHNYSQTFGNSQIPITEELEYRTNVNQSEPDYQQRISARPHGPYRTLEYHITPSGRPARSRLQGALYAPAQHYSLPVWFDVGLTTGLAASGTNTIPCDTTKRDYEALSYCGICTDPSDPFTYEFRQISAVADAQLTVATNLGSSFPTGSYVFPARIASIDEDSISFHSYAADHEDVVIRFQVLESELSTRRITSYTPAETYKSVEVFSLESAKVQFLDDRPFALERRIQGQGRDYQFARDSGSAQTFPVRFLLTSRSALSEFHGWLDQRQGKLNPVWISTREHDYTALARPTSSTLTVRKAGYSFHHGRRDLEILKTDGSVSRVRLTAITDNGDQTETLTAASFPSLATISRISFLKFCTLASDTIILKHYKGQISECSLSFRDLLTSPT